MIVFLCKLRAFCWSFFRHKPEPKHWDLPAPSKKSKPLNLSQKQSYCWRCPWGKLHNASSPVAKVECRLRGKVYGRRKLERGTVHCHEEARVRAGNLIINPAG